MQLQGKIPWRISSTLYAHVRYDVMLEPLAPFATVVKIIFFFEGINFIIFY